MIRFSPKYQRLVYLLLLLLFSGLAVFFALRGFQKEVAFFKKPEAFQAGDLSVGRKYRIGGLVKSGSYHYDLDHLEANFIITDHHFDIPVHYVGVLPDLFRENQVVVVEGKFSDYPNFEAESVLAKHDENYKPPGLEDL